MADLVGPCKIECVEQCDVPADVVLTEVPRPRHDWADVLNCPNDGCEKSFMVREPARG